MAAKKKTRSKTAERTTRSAKVEHPAGRERAKRPTLPRTDPIRSWSTLFGPGNAAAGSQAAAAAVPNAQGSVQRGVELGYRVMEDYLKQGTQAAAAFGARPRDVASFPFQDGSPLAERMMRSAQDFSALWFDMVGRAMSNSPGQAQGAERWRTEHGAGSGHDPAARPAGARFRVVQRVDCARPHETTLTLDEWAPAITLEPLRGAAHGQSLEASLELSEASGPVARLTLRVPADLQADRYSAAVVQASDGRPVGRVTLTILE